MNSMSFKSVIPKLLLSASLLTGQVIFLGGCSSVLTPEDPVTRAGLRLTLNKLDDHEEIHISQSAAESRNYEIQHALDAGEITLGMKKNDVLSAWGTPSRIET